MSLKIHGSLAKKCRCASVPTLRILVEGVTKIGQYKPNVTSQAPGITSTIDRRVHRKRQAETYRKLLLATAEGHAGNPH